MIPIMITNTCTALWQADPPDSHFKSILSTDSIAVADLGREASGSISEFLWPGPLGYLVSLLFIFLLSILLYRIINSRSRQIEMEVTGLRMELMDTQKKLNSCCGRLEETIRETGHMAKTNTRPRRSPSPSNRRKVAQTDYRSGEPFTQMSGENILKSHEEIQNTTL